MTFIQQRRDTAANWTFANPVLRKGEMGWETDTRKGKLGDGESPWNLLDYIVGEANVTKEDIGLGEVDNTSDQDKPVSSATQAALDAAVADFNDALALRPTSEDVDAALDTKAPLASPGFTGNPTAPTPALGNNDTSIATTAFVKGAIAQRLDTDTYWYASTAAVEAASTVAGWVAHTGVVPVSDTDDVEGDCYEAIAGGVRIKKVGRYIVEFNTRVAGGTTNVRNGLGLRTSGGSSTPSGGGPMPGYQLTGIAVLDNYFTITRPFVIKAGPVDITAMYYCQSATSHQGQINAINVHRIA